MDIACVTDGQTDRLTNAALSPRRMGQRWSPHPSICIFQCLLFYRSQTLLGSKQWVYVMMKILKLVTQPTPKLTSYQMKFAVDQALLNMTPTDDQIGECIKKVLQYSTMMGKFDNRVHEELAEMGLERVEVTDQGLKFIGREKARIKNYVIA